MISETQKQTGEKENFLVLTEEANVWQLVVWNDDVNVPLTVRYAWLYAGEANLINESKLPAYSFEKRAD